MNKLLVVVLFLSSYSVGFSQIILEETFHDFGNLEANDSKYYDFKITNASQDTIAITDYEMPYGISILFKSKELKPDSSTIIRIKYTPKRKGEFKSDISIWVSSNNEPLLLSLKGKVVSYDSEETMTVPSFTSGNKSQSGGNLLVEVVDKETGEPIPNAKVDIIWDGVIYQSLTTNEKGLSSKKLQNDNYYFIASAQNYASAEIDMDVSGSDQVLRIELGEGSGEIVVIEPEISKVDSGQALQDEIADVPIQVPDTIKPQMVDIDTTSKEDEIVITSEHLPENQYAPNNIVFLIDVSVSMRSQGKLDLLKASMIELTSLLRTSDKVAIVTYSSQTKVALQSTTVSNKDEIIEVIKSLEAGGKTAGTKGIKRAYKVLNSNFIADGNNQIFISTDGAFNLEKKDRKLLKIVKKNAKKGAKISVLGIKNKTWTVKNMEEIARTGMGSYIHIENYEGAKSSLITEIKKQSIKE